MPMAEEVLKKLEEQLNCSICLETYTDPKLLQCFHVYCQQCLVPLVDRNRQGQLGLPCPSCRQVTPIPDRGVGGLQSAFLINNLLDIHRTSKVENPESTSAAKAAPTDVKFYCSAHEGSELQLYCETCGEVICLRCLVRGGEHHGHDHMDLGQSFDSYKAEILLHIKPMERQMLIVKEALAQLDAQCGKISNQWAATANSIHITFRKLQEALYVRETELISHLDQMTQSKLKRLAAQKDQIETTLAQLSSCLHFMKESLGQGHEVDVLMMRKNTIKQVTELATPFKPEILTPNTEANIVFSTLSEMTAMCRDFGQISALSCNHATLCGMEVRVKSAIILEATDFRGQPSKQPINLLECETVSVITGNTTKCDVDRKGLGQYEITYLPTIKGRHQLHVKAEGHGISRTPFSIEVRSTVASLGAPILTICGVEGPWGIAMNLAGEVVVTELGRHCISVYSPNGRRLWSFGTHGSRHGQFRYPRGVAVDGKGNILVADSMNHRIQKFTAEGHFIALAGGTRGIGAKQFAFPTGIACNDNLVYVTDNSNHRVQTLNSDLTFLRTFGVMGSGEGRLNSPWDIACDSTGKVYVADTESHCIKVFKADGTFVSTIGCLGQGKGELGLPIGVAIDATGIVYITEYQNHRISIFSSEVTSFGKWGERPGEFACPRGIMADRSGVVYVCDGINNRIQLF